MWETFDIFHSYHLSSVAILKFQSNETGSMRLDPVNHESVIKASDVVSDSPISHNYHKQIIQDV